jgi:hypothetical protein
LAEFIAVVFDAGTGSIKTGINELGLILGQRFKLKVKRKDSGPPFCISCFGFALGGTGLVKPGEIYDIDGVYFRVRTENTDISLYSRTIFFSLYN